MECAGQIFYNTIQRKQKSYPQKEDSFSVFMKN